MAVKKEVTREEDYRDYEERDLQDGWPYSDDAGGSSQGSDNRPYGQTKANFDEDGNKSFTVTSTGFDGQQEPQDETLVSQTRGLEVSDDIEERVMDALTDLEGVSAEMIDIRSEGTVVILEGDIDDAATVRRLVKVAQRVPGVTGVRNNLTVIGVDANIPDDD
ncbi:MAG: BON domain-containing protein [Acidobacteriaceae bacterium]|nr:BON domain-containing protein [Acidobacteriaceae bacterium]